jgi:hypothetical protein
MTDIALEQKLKELAGLQADLGDGDFLLTWEHSLAAIRSILLMAECLQTLHGAGRSLRVFDTGLAVSIFRDQSTRTRFSFASAAGALGLTLADLDEAKSQIAHGETVRETAVMISFLAEAIGIRDDLFLGEGNRYMREVAAALQEGYDQGVLTNGRRSSTCSATSTTRPRHWPTCCISSAISAGSTSCAAASSSFPGPIRRATASPSPCRRA